MRADRFAIVVIAVVAVGCAVLIVLLIADRDGFSRARGGLWVFYGEPDTGPHSMPGVRDEDRHSIDPEVAPEIEAAHWAHRRDP